MKAKSKKKTLSKTTKSAATKPKKKLQTKSSKTTVTKKKLSPKKTTVTKKTATIKAKATPQAKTQTKQIAKPQSTKSSSTKKPTQTKPNKQQHLSIFELFNQAHDQVLREQQAIRNLEHKSSNFTQHFNNQRGGGQPNRIPRTMHHSRGK